MGLLRYQIFMAYGAAFLSIWSYALLSMKGEYSASPELAALIDYAPIWAVLAIAFYLLSALILGVLSFRTCPEAAVELELDITMARAELGRRGLVT